MIETEHQAYIERPLIELQLDPEDKRNTKRVLLLNLLRNFVGTAFAADLTENERQPYDHFGSLIKKAVAEAKSPDIEVQFLENGKSVWWYRPAGKSVVFRVVSNEVSYLIEEDKQELPGTWYYSYDFQTQQLSCLRRTHWQEGGEYKDVPVDEASDRLAQAAYKHGLYERFV